MKNQKDNVNNQFIAVKNELENYLYRLTASKTLAFDLTQDTYLKVIEKFSGFTGKSSFKTWVFSIATNLAKDNFRTQKRWAIHAQDLCKEEARTNTNFKNQLIQKYQSQTLQQYDLAEHLNTCFMCISKNLELNQQIAIILREIYQFERNEIAQILVCTEGVVKHLLFDGRKHLQEKYAQRCALINKKGTCYQCAELNDFFQPNTSAAKIKSLHLSENNSSDENLNLRFKLLQSLNPCNGNGIQLQQSILDMINQKLSGI